MLQSEDGKVLETFFHQNQNSCRCLFDKGKRFYFDKKRQVCKCNVLLLFYYKINKYICILSCAWYDFSAI